MDNTLEKCPFCNGDAKEKTDIQIIAGKVVNQFWIQCNQCGARSAVCDSYTEALSRWQNRVNK